MVWRVSRIWKNNSLTIVLLAVFFVSIAGMSIAGSSANNDERADRNQPPQSYSEYVMSGNFVEGMFENWKSEFLAVGALIVLFIILSERGSPESKLVGRAAYDTQIGSG